MSVVEIAFYRQLMFSQQHQNGGSGGDHSTPNPRTNASREAPAAGKYQSWGRNNGPPATRPAWGGRPRYEGTGSNVTPLGTPIRMSPFSVPPVIPTESEPKSIPTKNTAPVDVSKTKGAKQEGKPKKDKRDKKRKADSAAEEV